MPGAGGLERAPLGLKALQTALKARLLKSSSREPSFPDCLDQAHICTGEDTSYLWGEPAHDSCLGREGMSLRTHMIRAFVDERYSQPSARP
jgi:hypothetical protein